MDILYYLCAWANRRHTRAVQTTLALQRDSRETLGITRKECQTWHILKNEEALDLQFYTPTVLCASGRSEKI